MKKKNVENTTAKIPDDFADKYTMDLVSKNVSWKYGDIVFDFVIRNQMDHNLFSQSVQLAASLVFSDKDETYAGYMPWARAFAERFALIHMFTNIELTDIPMEQVWFFVFHSPVCDMINDLCGVYAGMLLGAIDDAIETKRQYLIHHSDIIGLIKDVVDKIDSTTQGFENMDLGALTTFLTNAQGIQGADLVSAISNGLGAVFQRASDKSDNDDEEVEEVVIGSQKKEAEKK